MRQKLFYFSVMVILISSGLDYVRPDDLNWQTSLWPEAREYDGVFYHDEDFGQSVAVGDVNGDGYDDVVVSSDIWVYVYEGPLPAQDGWDWAQPMLKIGDRYSRYVPNFYAVALADVNNDNIMDIIIGEDEYSQSDSPWYIYVFYGKTEWTTSYEPLELDDYNDSDWSVGSPSGRPGGGFGKSLANAGDVNADGIDDIIVGAPSDEGKGKAYVYYGSAAGLPADFQPDGIIPPYGEWEVTQRGISHRIDGSLGAAVARDGHYIGQGFESDNFIIGIPYADIDLNGNGYISSNEENTGTALIGPRWWCLSGDNKYGTKFGYVLGNAGDVNGDGHPEVLVCARKWVVAPKIFLYLGDDDRINTTERDIPYDWSVENIPYNQINNASAYGDPSVGSAGDINGDGYGDIFIGDRTYNPDNTLGQDGRVHIWYGGPATTDDPSGLGLNQTPESADIILSPSNVLKSYVPTMCTTFGWSVAVGDIDGNGLSDMVVGDPWAFHPMGGTEPGVQSGAVHVFYAGEPTPTGPTYLRVTYPNGGEVWYVGQEYHITWVTDQYVGRVRIEISTNNGSSWWDVTQGRNTTNDGRYGYTPDTVSDNCLFRITYVDNPSIRDQSDDVFSVVNQGQCSIQILSPNGGETWTSGNTYSITWTSSDASSQAKILYSINNGNDWEYYTTTTNDGSRSWTIPDNINSTECLVQVVDANDDNCFDVSDATFSIVPESGLPVDWSYTSSTGNSANIILPNSANPNIEGTPLANGDYIGIFSPSGLCCGWRQWLGQDMALTAWGNNSETTEIDGFLPGETIAYRVYRTSAQKEWRSVIVGYAAGNGVYSANGYMELNRFDVSDALQITLNLLQGWNMFSINVNPANPDIVAVMNPIVDKVKIVKNNDGFTYVPRFGINDIGNINYKEGYQAYMLQPASLDVSGQYVDPTTPITLPQGWSMISYLPNTPIDAATALASISDQLKIAKNSDGYTYVPRFGINDIGNMLPGQGYQVYLLAARTLVYPAGSMNVIQNDKITSAKTAHELLTEHFQFTSNTGGNATVVVTTDAAPQYSDGTSLAIGDEIGVFTSDNLCCGAIVWEGTNRAITVWQNNPETATIDGFTVGDTMRFRVWRKNDDTEHHATVSYEQGQSSTFQPNGFSVVTSLVAIVITPTGDWIVQDSGVSENLYCVKAVNQQVAWAVGVNATVIKTTDGETWYNAAGAFPDTMHFYNVDAFDENTAFITGVTGDYQVGANVAHIYRTTDGGNSWMKVFEVARAWFDNLTFFNRSTGIVVSDPIDGYWTVYRTTDGGNIWNSIENSPAAYEGAWSGLGAFCWLDHLNGWFGTNMPYIYHTTDGGITWSEMTVPFLNRTTVLAFKATGTGIVGDSRGSMIRTNDWGTNWENISTPEQGIIRHIKSHRDNFWALVDSAIYKSTNNGDGWQLQTKTSNNLWGLSVKSNQQGTVGWAVGSNGLILKFRNDVEVGIHDHIEAQQPDQFVLHQNYPNPFNPRTNFRFALKKAGHVKLEIFNTHGQTIAVIIDQQLNAGEHEIKWNAADVASGVYVCRFQVNDFTGNTNYVGTKKIVLMK